MIERKFWKPNVKGDQDRYEDNDYWVHYKFVDKPRKKPKMKVVYGGIVNER